LGNDSKIIVVFSPLSCIILSMRGAPPSQLKGEMRMSTYNGWTNWETWKVNLELLDGLDASDLNIEHYTQDEYYEAGQVVEEYVGELISMEYNTDGFVSGIVHGFLQTVNWSELAKGFIDQWVEDHPEEQDEEEEAE
jgi:hypothetical protein